MSDSLARLLDLLDLEQIEEERRLLYVAITRARRHLALSWASARSPGAAQARQRSRFLAGLVQPAGAAQAQAQVPGGRQ